MAGKTLRQSFRQGRYSEAVAAARKLLQAARQAGDNAPKLVAAAAFNLAVVQARAGEPIDAIEHYEQALALLRAAGGNRNPRLVRPLRGIGTAAFELGNYRRAATAFARAAFISRAVGGPGSRAQLRAYDGLIAANVALARFDVAARYQRKRLAVIAHAAGRNSADYAGQLLQTARWFRAIGWYREARELYREQRDRARQSAGADAAALVPVLYGLAATFRGADGRVRVALQALRQARSIQRGAEQPQPVALARTSLKLGDLYLAYGAFVQAQRAYRQAYELLDRAGAKDKLRDLATPDPIVWPRMSRDVPLLLDANAEPVRMSFTVTAQGEVRDVKVLEPGTVGPGLQARATETVADALFRPRITAQGPVPTEHVSYRYQWAP